VLILVGIDNMELPANIIIFKPNYIIMGVTFLIECYILYIVSKYTKSAIEKITLVKVKQKVGRKL